MKKQAAAAAAFAILFLGSAALNVIQYRKTNSFSQAAVAAAPDTQSQILCEVAKEHLKEHWADQKPNIEKVIQVVNSKAEMEAKLQTTLDEVAAALSLSPEQSAHFRASYENVYFEHVGAFRERLNQKPEPDWPGMFQTLKKFYAAEDALIAATYGAKALAKFRNNQAQKRTPMLALIGQYANVAWDASIRW
ncbi:MAG TPA: hypothetical protein VFV50_08905 [Bdellovibrionales bacterium]|nr:hypothetical protein [Bdellovibrionales bacterium]